MGIKVRANSKNLYVEVNEKKNEWTVQGGVTEKWLRRYPDVSGEPTIPTRRD